MTALIAPGVLLAILLPLGWLMIRYAVRTGTLAEQARRAQYEASKAAASSAALQRHVEPKDVVRDLSQGTF